MEQRSGLLSLASLMDRLDENLGATVSIYPSYRYYKELHLRPQFIKGNQVQTIKVRKIVFE